MITRRALIGSAAVASLLRPKPILAQTTGVTPIAIRWDAWYSTAQPGVQAHNGLGAQRWQFRAPWYSRVISDYRIECIGTQAHMDIEIQAAANAGIKAFLFNWTGGGADGVNPPAEPSFFIAHQLYQASPNKALIKWCGDVAPLAVGYNPYSNTAGWHANANQWVGYFQQSNYLKVGGRPVLFVTWSEDLTYFGGVQANITASFAYLRSQSIAAGAGDPYLIVMGDPYGVTRTASQALPIIGGQAISSYQPNVYAGNATATAADLNSQAAAWWASQVATGNKVAPNAIVGWDTRPVVQMPPTWIPRVPWLGNNLYFTPSTNAEVAAQFQSCVNFIGSNQPACDSKIMLMYSWNECYEGGKALIPTIGDPPTGTPPTTGLLTAIKPVLTAAA
jgi:hypothetical protein